MLEDSQDEDDHILEYDQISVLLHPPQHSHKFTKRDWFKNQIV